MPSETAPQSQAGDPLAHTTTTLTPTTPANSKLTPSPSGPAVCCSCAHTALAPANGATSTSCSRTTLTVARALPSSRSRRAHPARPEPKPAASPAPTPTAGQPRPGTNAMPSHCPQRALAHPTALRARPHPCATSAHPAPATRPLADPRPPASRPRRHAHQPCAPVAPPRISIGSPPRPHAARGNLATATASQADTGTDSTAAIWAADNPGSDSSTIPARAACRHRPRRSARSRSISLPGPSARREPRLVGLRGDAGHEPAQSQGLAGDDLLGLGEGRGAGGDRLMLIAGHNRELHPQHVNPELAADVVFCGLDLQPAGCRAAGPAGVRGGGEGGRVVIPVASHAGWPPGEDRAYRGAGLRALEAGQLDAAGQGRRVAAARLLRRGVDPSLLQLALGLAGAAAPGDRPAGRGRALPGERGPFGGPEFRGALRLPRALYPGRQVVAVCPDRRRIRYPVQAGFKFVGYLDALGNGFLRQARQEAEAELAQAQLLQPLGEVILLRVLQRRQLISSDRQLILRDAGRRGRR